uniref:Uncharacterized protein n=1 Tax=Oryza meridionalis TaxID=40149 RepID=A0A0E0ES72_9ORYZ
MGWSLERNIPPRSGTNPFGKIGRTSSSHLDGAHGVSSATAGAPPRPPASTPVAVASEMLGAIPPLTAMLDESGCGSCGDVDAAGSSGGEAWR